ncbi:hypothetical protein [Streptomyces sp. NPDC059009]|uniref:hypothetical protein n=1 Tax=Streptomyces sp. NPDC059009 TaxID=3346694 RepID=UPI0036C82D8E
MSDFQNAERAPAPGDEGDVRAYTPYQVVSFVLRVDGQPFRAVASAHHDAPDGRRAYRLHLWPSPRTAPHGWYWWDPERMTRRDRRRSTD